MAVADKFSSAALHDLAEADEEVSKSVILRLVMAGKAYRDGDIHCDPRI